jgi:aryl-alcohol dehydrogenase-like predicted oxidoreductase
VASLPALATPEGTRRYEERMRGKVARGHFRTWPGPMDGEDQEGTLRLSSLGMGSYTGPLTPAADEQYRDAVREALRSGINVIDCAINYRHMRSERSLGEGIRAAIADREVARDEILIMTKGGYVPFDGQAPADPAAYVRKTYVESGIVAPAEIVAGSHCIAPRYLQDQLDRSLRNFGLDAVDVYFLHNVEQQLDEVSRPEFLTRVEAAFRYLESEADRGRIGMYGVATWNGFRVPAERREHLDLAELFEVAERVGKDSHRFRVLQLPYNLGMLEAVNVPSQSVQGQQVPILVAAQVFGMLTVTSVPLLQGQILGHLPTSFARMPGLETPAQRALQFVRSSPGVHAPLVGMKTSEHVRENARVATVAPLGPEQFQEAMGG